MENWEAVLLAERLRFSTAETVYGLLNALTQPAGMFEENLPDSVLDTLLGRHDPLVDLGLARFASKREKLLPLWGHSKVLRLALLSNRNAGPVFPDDGVADILSGGSDDELRALLTNPSASPGLLTRVINNDFSLPVSRWQITVLLTLRNERTHSLRVPETWNEFTETMAHESPMRAAWKLFETVAATNDWAHILQQMAPVAFTYSLLDSYLPDLSTEEGRREWDDTFQDRHRKYEEVLLVTVQERWADRESEEDVLNLDRAIALGGATEAEKMRMRPWFWARAAFSEAVARTKGHSDLTRSLRNHSDQAFRVGWYAGARVLPHWSVNDFFERDGMEFVDAIMGNRSLYERANHALQSLVRSFARDRANNDDYRVGWMTRRLTELQALDPETYGDTPTPAMEAEERRLEEERFRQEQAQAQRHEASAREQRVGPPPKQKSPFWRNVGLGAAAVLLGLAWLIFQ